MGAAPGDVGPVSEDGADMEDSLPACETVSLPSTAGTDSSCSIVEIASCPKERALRPATPSVKGYTIVGSERPSQSRMGSSGEQNCPGWSSSCACASGECCVRRL